MIKLPDNFSWSEPDYNPVWLQRIEMLKRIRSGEVDLAALKKFYKDHPAEFLTDFATTFDPRMAEVDLPTTMPFVLFPAQVDTINWMRERWLAREDGLIEKSRDAGISYVMCGFAVWMFLFHEGTTFGMASRKESYVALAGDPGALLWKVMAIIASLPKEIRPEGFVPSIHATRMLIRNPENGSVIVGESGDNCGRGNRYSYFACDEFAFMDKQDNISAALSQSANAKLFLSTPNGVGNLFHRMRFGGKIKVRTIRWQEDPRKSPKDPRDDMSSPWYRKQIETLEPRVIAQEINIDYAASIDDAFIPGDIVVAALKRGPADVSNFGPVMVGVDVARFGSDKSCITVRQGRLVSRVEVFGKADIVDVTGRVLMLCRSLPEQPAQIAVDTIGVGAGVADMLRRDASLGGRVVDVNSSIRVDDGCNYNLRAVMWAGMKEWLKGPVSIPTGTDLESELTSLRYKFKGGLMLIENKDDAKARGIKSPDCADSLALTFAIAPKQEEIPPQAQAAWAAFDDLTSY